MIRTLAIASNSAAVLSINSDVDLPSISKVSEFSRPPSRKSSSARITRAPARPAVKAADNPAGPAPITKTSQCKNPRSYLSGSSKNEMLPSPAALLMMGS